MTPPKRHRYALSPLRCTGGNWFSLTADDATLAYVASLSVVWFVEVPRNLPHTINCMIDPRYNAQEAYQYVLSELDVETREIPLKTPWRGIPELEQE